MVDVTHLVGVALALGAAIAGASNRLFVRVGTERGTATEAFFVVMTISTLVLVPVVGVAYYPDYGLTPVAWLSFLGAGLVATLLGNVFLYTSITRIGASRTQPIVASNALVSIALALVLLGETMTAVHGVGVVVIVAGVAVIAWETSHENPDDLPRRTLLLSLLLPFATAVTFGSEPIFANFGFAEGTPAMVGLAVKTGSAWLGFTAYARWRGTLPPVATLRRRGNRWFAFAGIAYVLFLVGYYAGLAVAPVNVVIPIIITNTLWVIVLSVLFMPRRLERITWRLAGAAAAVVLGAIVVSVYG